MHLLPDFWLVFVSVLRNGEKEEEEEMGEGLTSQEEYCWSCEMTTEWSTILGSGEWYERGGGF